MNRHERLKAKAKAAEKKIDPARAREAEELRKVISDAVEYESAVFFDELGITRLFVGDRRKFCVIDKV